MMCVYGFGIIFTMCAVTITLSIIGGIVAAAAAIIGAIYTLVEESILNSFAADYLKSLWRRP